MFAKLYGTDDKQILVTLADENGAKKITFHAERNGHVATFGLKFDPDLDGENSAREAFDKITEDKAVEAVRGAIERKMI